MAFIWVFFSCILLSVSGCGVPGDPVGLQLRKASRVGGEPQKGCDQVSSELSSSTKLWNAPKGVSQFHFPESTGTAQQKTSEFLIGQGQELAFALSRQCYYRELTQVLAVIESWGEVSLRRSSLFLIGTVRMADSVALSEIKTDLGMYRNCLVTIELQKTLAKVGLPADPGFGNQDYMQRIGFHSAYPQYKDRIKGSSTGVLVAVIDSGIDLDHSDLLGQIWTNPAEIADNGIDDDNNGYIDDLHGYNFADDLPNPESPVPDDDLHGTAVAGLIAAAENDKGIVGVAPVGVKLMSLNVFSSRERVSAEAVAVAIDYAATGGAKVINLSLAGAGDSSVLRLAIENAIASGATLITAAGNFGVEVNSNDTYTPGSYGPEYLGLINVGSVNSQDLSFSLFSNFSSERVEISAPGAFQYSLGFTQGLLVLSSGGGYTRLQGTSFAAPLVSGAAAVAIGLHRLSRGADPSPGEVEELLVGSGVQFQGLSGKVRNCRFLNLESLVKAL